MKRYFLTIMVVFMATISLFAQEQLQQDTVQSAAPAPKYGIVSYSKVMQSMAEYADMQDALAKRKAQYEQELQRAADEFNEKYESFLSEQKTYAPSILRKHQSELESLLSHNEQFKKDCQQDLETLRQTLMAPITDRLTQVLNYVAQQEQLAFVINSDNNNVPYIDPQQTKDITALVIAVLANSQEPTANSQEP